jgi:hypothetical protein
MKKGKKIWGLKVNRPEIFLNKGKYMYIYTMGSDKPQWRPMQNEEKQMKIDDIRIGLLKKWEDKKDTVSMRELGNSIQDLEYNRWWLHHKWLETVTDDFKKYLTQRNYWTEVGAFVCTLSRQQGKTELLARIARDLKKDIVIVTPFMAMKGILIKRGLPENTEVLVGTSAVSYLCGRDISKTHLLVEEHQLLTETVNNLLNGEWKTVSLFGSFK